MNVFKNLISYLKKKFLMDYWAEFDYFKEARI